MNEVLTAVIAALVGGGTFWGAVKSGLIKIQIGKNGNGTKETLERIETNHLEHIEQKLEKLIDLQEKEQEQHSEMLFILRDLKK